MFLPSSSNSPLLRSNNNEESFHTRSTRRYSLRDAIRVFQRASNRTGLMMREPSEQIDDRQSNWAYSKPVVVMDIFWNFMYIIAAILVLVLSRNDDPEMPLRVWIVGYCLLCLVHVVSVYLEYRRRGYAQSPFTGEGFGSPTSTSSSYVTLAELTPERTSNLTKYMDSANTMLSFFWWIIGFYWVCTGGQRMVDESPQLYWLCIVFLAFDVFFVVFLFVTACVIGLGICCCLPCIIAVLYAVADKYFLQKGAGKEDVEQLSKYIFRRSDCTENCTGEIQGTFAGFMTLCGGDTPTDERSVSVDDAECSICLSTYDDEDELRELPCCHLFHCNCIDKWLYMSATCPLCKRSIVGATSCCEEV
ncbi:E3 ubiquitin-protein ligase At4g11680-like isoform X2 [Solanum dulcamara]|uniref:E3 ubiquitin-protein ligase At4g11680-like isoform X2 n=1 Tax=Solanum dulcamara TaxID=45834 RepID=UPI002484FA89|nr:E3 ubiquitin-protein ligase At4g11680-like isoform X2 [Solanum dulcamara]